MRDPPSESTNGYPSSTPRGEEKASPRVSSSTEAAASANHVPSVPTTIAGTTVPTFGSGNLPSAPATGPCSDQASATGQEPGVRSKIPVVLHTQGVGGSVPPALNLQSVQPVQVDGAATSSATSPYHAWASPGRDPAVAASFEQLLPWPCSPSKQVASSSAEEFSATAAGSRARPSTAPTLDEGGVHQPPMEHALDAAMRELSQCRVSLGQLRAGRCHAVPIAMVEHWCEGLASQLALMGDTLGTKLESLHTKIRQRDATILRLHRRLQAQPGTSGDTCGPHAPQRSVDLSTITSEGYPVEEEPCPSPDRPSSSFAEGSVEARHASSVGSIGGSSSTTAAGELIDNTLSIRVTAPSICSGNDTTTHDAETTYDRIEDGSPLNSPMGIPTSTPPGEKISAAARLKRAGETTWSNMNRRNVSSNSDAHMLDRAQQAQLRREVAQLRRCNVELAGQLRARDAQAEQLMSMLHDLVQQRQGNFKPQPIPQDHSAPSLQEMLEISQKISVPSAPPSAVSSGPLGTEALRRGRSGRVTLGAQMLGSSSSAAQGSGAGSPNVGRGSRNTVPKVSDPERPRLAVGPQLSLGSTAAAARAAVDGERCRLGCAAAGSVVSTNAITVSRPSDVDRCRMAGHPMPQQGPCVSTRIGDADRSRAMGAAVSPGGTGPSRHIDSERNRAPTTPVLGNSATVAMASRRDRDLSAFTLPHTPRGKFRDATGLYSRAAAETPASRRRTTSTVRTVRRSTSAEDRVARRPRDIGVGSNVARQRR